MRKFGFTLSLIPLLFLQPALLRAGGLTLLPGRENIRVQLLTQGRALIEERCYLDLSPGINNIYFNWEGVRIEPGSLCIDFLDEPEKIVLVSLSSSLTGPNSQTWQVKSLKEGKELVQISYLMEGFSLQMSYQALANQREEVVNLSSYLTLVNNTGQDFRQAQFTAPGGFEWILDLKNGEGKKILLFTAEEIPLKKQYIFDAAVLGKKVVLWYSFSLESSHGAREIIFPGIARIYRKEARGELTFLGEDRISKGAPGEKIELCVGMVGDLQVKREKILFEKAREVENDRGIIQLFDTLEEYQITVNNYKEESVLLQVREHIPHSWEMIKSQPEEWEKKEAHLIQYILEVPANQEKKIVYRIKRKNLLPREPIRPLAY